MLLAYGSIGARENIVGATAAVAEELMGASTALVENSACHITEKKEMIRRVASTNHCVNSRKRKGPPDS